MQIGIPKEIKKEEYRVAVAPAGVSALTGRGHAVLIEKGAGEKSGITDDDYKRAGAVIVPSNRAVWEGAELIVKVREPEGSELEHVSGHVIFSYLHLAADPALAAKLLKTNVTAISYETVQTADGYLPLLAPMSEVCGRLSIQKGAYGLEKISGGSGVLLSGVSGVPAATVVILGAGIAGFNAAFVAAGIGTEVFILDTSPTRLKYAGDMLRGKAVTVMSNKASVEEYVSRGHVVVGAVLIPGARTPHLISRDLVKKMKPGSVIVDLAIDQGGISETSRPTTHNDRFFVEEGIVHYAVPNMPGAVPRTASFALSGVTITYVLELADKGFDGAIADNPSLKRGVNIHKGKVVHRGVAEACSETYCEL
ncbi:MAG: alanine dehydrogenase [Deltaproteobacteria bacterium]|nr:alanine dehydrogenase [Candidatus Zymogenaceae bacterium]